MTWIDAGVSELRSAFHSHLRAREDRGNKIDCSNNLLLFYAAECGLKAAWLRRNNLRTMGKKLAEDRHLGHDLSYWAKELRISAASMGFCTSFRLRRNESHSHPVGAVHQAWRYGVRICSEDEEKLISGMNRLVQWIKEELQR